MSKCRLLKPMYKIDRTDGTPNQRLALVIVIAIIGISVALVTPGYQDYTAKAQARAEQMYGFCLASLASRFSD